LFLFLRPNYIPSSSFSTKTNDFRPSTQKSADQDIKKSDAEWEGKFMLPRGRGERSTKWNEIRRRMRGRKRQRKNKERSERNSFHFISTFVLFRKPQFHNARVWNS
jgi:hypothetical protein